MRSARSWVGTCAAAAAFMAILLGGWNGRSIEAGVDWRDGRAALIDSVHSAMAIADPRAAKVVAMVPVAGIDKVTELTRVWIAETDRTSKAPRRMISIDKATRRTIAQQTFDKGDGLVASGRALWLIGLNQRAQQLDPRSLEPVGDSIRLFSEADLASAVVNGDGTLAVLDGPHRNLMLIRPDGRRTSLALRTYASRLVSSRTQFWIALPRADAIGVVAGGRLHEIPAGLDLTDDAVLASDTASDLLALVQPEQSRATTVHRNRIGLIRASGVVWTKDIPLSGELRLVDGEPTLVANISSGGIVRFVTPPGEPDVTVKTEFEPTTNGNVSIWVDGDTLYLDDPMGPETAAITGHVARKITKWNTNDGRRIDPGGPSRENPSIPTRGAETIRNPTSDDRRPEHTSSQDTGSGTKDDHSADQTGTNPTPSPGGTPVVTGDVTTADSPLVGPTTTIVPEQPPSHPKVTAIAASGDHTCALTDNGTVRCWGSTAKPQETSPLPKEVLGLGSRANAITLTGDLSCAHLENTKTKCWGYNPFSEFLDDTWSTSAAPRELPHVPGIDVTTVRTDNFSCAITTARSVKCWGRGQYSLGEMGQGRLWWDELGPVEVHGLSTEVVSIEVARGGSFTCALTINNGVDCWGASGIFLVGPDIANSEIPEGIRAVSTAGTSACALAMNGRVGCWGYQQSYRKPWPRVPIEVLGVTSGVSIAMFDKPGFQNDCVLTAEGTLKCWEDNSWFQLDNDIEYFGEPDSDEWYWAEPPWGWRRMVAEDVPGLSSGVVAITSGRSHACALTTDGTVKCWGDNSKGQLGNGTFIESLVPIGVAGLS